VHLTQDIRQFIKIEGATESKLSTHLLRAFRNRICASKQIIRDAIKQANATDVKLTSPTVAGISTGIASAISVAIAQLFPASFAVVAAPLIGGIALFIMEVTVDGFCEWTRNVTDADALRAADQETELARPHSASKKHASRRKTLKKTISTKRNKNSSSKSKVR
jgi:hypothetical protein